MNDIDMENTARLPIMRAKCVRTYCEGPAKCIKPENCGFFQESTVTVRRNRKGEFVSKSKQE
jgi:hypothetical protein